MSHPNPSAVKITLSGEERAELVRRTEWPDRRSAEKARILLACAEGMSNAGVARVVGVQAKTVGRWRRAFAAERMAGLEDAGWIGRPKADLVLNEAEWTQLTQWSSPWHPSPQASHPVQAQGAVILKLGARLRDRSDGREATRASRL
ncbi:helix-turn-helix domain-containing protein [Streptomyces sp. NBC_01383]|uniref:helix-turn-helix domain-containing protein n=1 Tax=Streptomyces sp. NBC_01383 TaxID=2903846 RepID=UPI00325093BE